MPLTVVSRKAIPGVGVGKPDYYTTTEVARGAVYESVGELRPTEKLVIFYIALSNTPSAYPWVRPPLAPGATAHLYDVETGIALPYTVPRGYNLEALSSFYSFDQPVRTQLYIDRFLGIPQLFSEVPMETLGIHYEHEIVGCGTSRLDPLGLTEHYIDSIGTNIGDAAATGMGYLVWKLTKVGSAEWPKTKKVACKACGAITEAPLNATRVICKCGATTLVMALTWGAKT